MCGCGMVRCSLSSADWNAGYYWAIEGGDFAVPNDCYYRDAWANGWHAGDKARKARYNRG